MNDKNLNTLRNILIGWVIASFVISSISLILKPMIQNGPKNASDRQNIEKTKE